MPLLLPGLTALLCALAALLLTGRLRATAEADSRLYDLRLHVVLALLLGAGAGIVATTWAEAVAYGVLAVACGLLIPVDIVEHRLPNALLAAAYPAMLLALLLAALVGTGGGAEAGGTAAWGDLGRALLAGLAVTTVYLVLALVAPAGLGMGDVKFSGLLGLGLGWAGWQAVLLGTVAGFVVNAVVALGVVLARRTRKAEVPFGPSMVAGTVLGLSATLL